MTRVRPSTLLAFLLVVELLSGCHRPEVIQVTNRYGPLPPPPSESVRAEIGPVAIVSALTEPQVRFSMTPASGAWSGLWRGAGSGALYGCAALGWPAYGGGYGAIVGAMGCLGGGIVGSISGGVYGAIAAEPAETVEAATTTVRYVLTNSDMQRKVQEQVRKFITAHTTVPQALSTESTMATSLEINVVSIELAIERDKLPIVGIRAPQGINPEPTLVVTVEVRLSSNSMGMHISTFQYRGQTMTFLEWARNDAQPVRDEIGRAVVSLAEQIVDGVFLLYPIQ